MSRAGRWDEEFAQFVAARSPQLYRQAWLLTSSPHAAEDLVQTALVKAYASWWRVRKASDPVAYVHAIVVKSFLSERRRKSSSEIAVADVPEPASDHHDHASRLTVEQALSHLQPTDRAVVVLRYWEDASVEQTAALLGLSQAAVKNRSLRALNTLRRHLAEPVGVPDEPTERSER